MFPESGYVIPEWTLADHLRKARQVAGMSQKEFAERLDVTPSSYAQWEAGNNKPRDVVAVAKRIEMLTRIPASWILGVHNGGNGPGGGSARPERLELPTFWPVVCGTNAQVIRGKFGPAPLETGAPPATAA